MTLAFIAGCTNTASELMADPKSYEGSIQLGVSPQTAYRNLREATRECLESSPLGTPVTVEGEFDSEIHDGRIFQRVIAQGVRINLSIIEIKPKAESASEIKLYTVKGLSAVGTHRPTLEMIRRWAGGGQSC